MYKVIITKKALKSLDKLPLYIENTFKEKFKELAKNPYTVPNIKKLTKPTFIPPPRGWFLLVGSFL